MPLGGLAYVVARPREPASGRELGAAVTAYLPGNTAPLRRLARIGARETAFSAPDPAEEALLASDCTDYALPFDGDAGPRARRRQLNRFHARRRPAWPVTVREAFGDEGSRPDRCVHWPILRPSPPVLPVASFPEVPVLAVGEQLDTNTPPAAAIDVAERFPRSTVFTVPFAGHLSALEGTVPTASASAT